MDPTSNDQDQEGMDNDGIDTSKSSTSRKRPRSDEGNTAAYGSNNNDNYYGSSVAVATNPALIPLLTDSLYGLLDGLPRKELRMIVSEAEECEKALEEELEELKNALKQFEQQKQTISETTTADTVNLSPSVNIMLSSEITPPDHQWTLSALLGRLRHDMTTPLPPNSQLPSLREQAGLQSLVMPKKKRTNSVIIGPPGPNNNAAGGAAGGDGSGMTSGRSTPNISADDSQFQRLAQIQNHPDYIIEHENTDRLLAVWRKISTHKSSLVFRRPVNPKDAPGYSERILFPMDLSLVRKLILAEKIRSYRDFAQRIHLIGHNCVKYNGRESDYALVTREFESYASEYIITAVYNHHNPLPVSGSGNVGRPSKQSKQMRTTTPTNATSTNSIANTDAAAAAAGFTSDEQKPEGTGITDGQKEQQHPDLSTSNAPQAAASTYGATPMDVDKPNPAKPSDEGENKPTTSTVAST